MFGDEAAMRVSACAPTATVYCHAGSKTRGLLCYANEVTCKLTTAMLAATLVGGEPLTACTPWTSVAAASGPG